MAANAVDTANEGEGYVDQPENINNDINMTEWLKQNRLHKFIDYFEENGLIMEDLLTYDEADLDSVLEDCNIKAHALKKRFKTAVRKVQFQSSQTGGADAGSGSFNRIQRVVITAKESESMKELETKLADIDVILKQTMDATHKIEDTAKKTDSEIENAFKSFRNKLNEREKLLRNKLKDESDKEMNALKGQQSNLKQYKKLIKDALSEQNGIVLDPKMDAKKREIKIVEITNNAMNGINNDDMKMDIATIEFSVDVNAVNQYVSAIGVVSADPDPPTLRIADVTASTAKIKLQSKYKKNLIRYRVKYGVQDNEDDEKKMHWTEKDLTNNTDECILNDLKDNTKYEIFGRYKVLENSKWSRSCNLHSFTTLKFTYPPFQWNPSTRRSSITLSNDNKTATGDTDASQQIFIAKNILSGSDLCTAEWEVTFRQIPTGKDRQCFTMGYIAAEALKSVSYDDWFGQREHQYSLWIDKEQSSISIQKYIYSSKTNCDEKWKSIIKCNVGDKMKLKFDFNKKQCAFYYNEQMVVLLSDDLSNEVYPGMSCLYDCSFETTKWVLIPKMT